MRTIAAFALLLATGAGAAQAADVYTGGAARSPQQAYAAPGVATVNWTGVYVGGQVGYGNANHGMEADLSETTTIPAHCREGSLSGESCWVKHVDTPASPAYCTVGFTMVGDECYSTDQFANGVLKDGASASPTAYHGAVGEISHQEEIPEAYVPTVDVTNTASAFIDGINSHGLFGGGTIGADFQKGAFVFGIFGDYNFSALETEAGVSVDGTSLGTVKAEEGDSWLVAARAGYLFGPRALLYGLVGYGQTDYDYTLSITGETPMTKSLTFSGLVLGAGGEYALSDNVFLGIEYQHFFGSKETLVDESWDGGSLKVTDELDTDKVMARLKVKLNGGLR